MKKIEYSKVKNLRALNFDLEHNDYSGGKFDLIFTQMVLHHVTDIESIIKRFSKLLHTGGYLAIADLLEEDGSFHGEGFNGHMGFNIEKPFRNTVKKTNSVTFTTKTCFCN